MLAYGAFLPYRDRPGTAATGREQKFKLRRYRSDGELAVAGANLVAGKSAARAFRHGLGGAMTAAEVCLRPIEAEPLT